MSVTLGYDNYAGLHDYLVLEGLAYRITPFRRTMGVMDTEKMYGNLMNRFHYGGVNRAGIYLDETNMRMSQTHRRMFTMLAQRLLMEGKKDKALAALRKSLEVLPPTTVPYEQEDYDLAEMWFAAGDTAQASKVAKEVARQNCQYLNWCNSLRGDGASAYQRNCAKSMRAIYQTVSLLNDAGAPEFKHYDGEFRRLAGTYAGSLGLEMLQQAAGQPAAQQ